MSQPQPVFHEYFYGSEADQFIFYRLPKALFTNPNYKYLSGDAKILYGMMLDRMSLSTKNGWLEDVQEHLNCQRDKDMKLLAELDTSKGVGLIERVRQGLGKPATIYVKKFNLDTDLQKSAIQTLIRLR